ncbi:hypothetical protein AAG906_029381 [Vitis piasezkii]
MLEDEQVAAAQHENNTMLWHKILGHFHHNVVLYMKKNQIVEGFPDLEEELSICAACQYGNVEINTKTTIGSHICWWTSEDTILEKDTSGYCFNFGFGVFSWNSKKQEVVAQSTTEAEYIAAVVVVNQTLWLRKFAQVFEDNQATISIANDLVFHDLSFYETKSRRSVESYALVSAERKAAIINHMQLKSTKLLEC